MQSSSNGNCGSDLGWTGEVSNHWKGLASIGPPNARFSLHSLDRSFVYGVKTATATNVNEDRNVNGLNIQAFVNLALSSWTCALGLWFPFRGLQLASGRPGWKIGAAFYDPKFCVNEGASSYDVEKDPGGDRIGFVAHESWFGWRAKKKNGIRH